MAAPSATAALPYAGRVPSLDPQNTQTRNGAAASGAGVGDIGSIIAHRAGFLPTQA
jgi:hypothetical protein